MHKHESLSLWPCAILTVCVCCNGLPARTQDPAHQLSHATYGWAVDATTARGEVYCELVARVCTSWLLVQ